jgi:DNA helicase II / ATP-dependent DNA helicase PcrA
MGVFEVEYRRLNAAQRDAVDSIEGPLLVVAGPGTGKTQLLSMRVANILRKTDVHPHNILCLTFTESGKEAMQLRLADFLGKAAKRVEVHTFHGFGNRLIARFSEFFPELDRFRPADDLTLYETLLVCMERLPRNNPLSKHAYGQFVYQSDASSRISQFKRAGIAPEAALAHARTDEKWCKSYGSKLASIFKQAGRLSASSASNINKDVNSKLEGANESELGNLCLGELNDALKEFEITGKTASLSSFKKKWFNSSDGNLYFKPQDQIKKLVALAELYSDYESELKRRRLYDYDDMILFALEKLKQNKELLASVQESFQYILADEYQDTNAAQASIINLIADNPVNEGRPNVMVVGDDDQAIYGFQGALGDVLMDFRERWREVKVITLKENYRSTKSILNTSRAIITQGQNRLENYYQDIDKSLIPRANHADVSPSLFEAGSAQSVVDKAVQVAKSNQGKQLAIIASKHKYLRELADKLDTAKVKYYYEGHEDLLKDDAMSKLLLLADMALAIKKKTYNRTNYLLPEILTLDLVGVTRPTAWQIAVKAKTDRLSWWEAMTQLKLPETKEATESLKSIARSLDPKQSADSLKDIAKQNHLRVIQKINHLCRLAQDYFEREDVTLSELLRYVDLCRQAGISLELKVIKGSQQANVVLLSAHKSKGLEFDRVYILHADHHTWLKEMGRRNILVLPENWKFIEPPGASMDDRLRLLYVVMTRAKQELALIKSSQAMTLPGLENLKIEQHVSEQLEAFNLPVVQTWREWYLPNSPKEMSLLKRLLHPTLKDYKLSSSHFTLFLDVTRGGPTTFFTNILLGIQEPVHPEAVFGSQVHKSLNFAQNHLNRTGKLPAPEQLTKFLNSETSIKSENHINDVVLVVTEFLKHSDILQEGGEGEYSFSSKNIVFEGKHLTGTVDHFVATDDNLVITDFKTGRAINSWKVSEDYYKQKLHRFRQQLMFYELLFKLSKEYRFVKSIKSKVVFVEPTIGEIYYQLTLDADQKERSEFESLLTAVWQKITNLDLPNIQAYGTDMNSISTFEDDLITGAI